MAASEINWADPSSKVSDHFTVKEACWLPRASLLYRPKPDERENLILTCELMEKVRALFARPLLVHCMIRPLAYNAVIGGAKGSAHLVGLACDFSVPGMDCDLVREMLLLDLERWGARMEDKPGTSWVHIDLAPVKPGGHRFFKP